VRPALALPLIISTKILKFLTIVENRKAKSNAANAADRAGEYQCAVEEVTMG
jgi:hypothetical protein